MLGQKIQKTITNIYGKADNNKQNIFENLYLIYFGLITMMAFKDTTMFSFGWSDTQLDLILIFGILVVFAKIACGRSWKLYEILIAGIAAGVLILCWHHYMRRYILDLVVLIIGARDVDEDKLVRVFLWVSTGCLIITMIAALTGQIENLIYIQKQRGNIARISFGSIYPTDFSAHVFFTAACYLWLRIRKIRYRDLALVAGLGIFCLYFCGARTSATGLWIFALFFLLKKKEILKENKKIQSIMCFVMPLCSVSSILLALFYRPECGWMRWINKILTNRFSQGHKGFERYSIPLLGQEVLMNGYGGAVHQKEGVEYFFLDCSYINILFQYGILVLGILIILSVWILFRLMKAGMSERMFILAVVFLCCIMEQHLLEISYHPFWLLTLAGIASTDKKNIFIREKDLWEKNHIKEKRGTDSEKK